MTEAPVRLIPLMCYHCRQPIPAQPDEVAWVCDTCQKGSILGDDGNLKPQDIFFSPNLPPGARGRPYWVAQGQVQITERQTYRGNESRDAAAFWGEGRLFFITAYTLPLEQQIATGMAMLRNPPAIREPAPPAPFLPVVTPQADIRPMAEFIILAIEADRKDALKTVKFTLTLQPPQLWVLPK